MAVNKVRIMLMKDGKVAIIESGRSKLFSLPGGDVKENQDEKETLKKDVLSSLGINIDIENIEGPFLIKKSQYLSRDEQGKKVYKIATSNFYLASTEEDFDFEKMQLTEKEKRRGVVPQWMNPAKLEYFLTEQKDTYQNVYARKYAEEYLNVYHKFLEYQRKREAEDRDINR